MVLKDFWIRLDSKTEGQIQAEIFQSAREELSDESGPEGFQKYFMTIVHDTVVDIGLQDTSPLAISQLLDLTKKYNHRLLRLPSANEYSAHETAPPSHSFQCRKHCRLVFQEVGKPLHQVKDLTVLFQCLHDALQGKFVNHSALSRSY